MSAAPWTDPQIVCSAFDIACDVRSLDPADAVPVDLIRQIPPETIADLIVTLAYMVDVDRPVTAITGHLGEIDDTRRLKPFCTVGHPSDEYGYWGRGKNPAQRCRQCDREIALRRSAAA